MGPNLLPLFPLGVVLLPSMRLPLHIFEDRYKELIGEAKANGTGFGILLAAEKGIASVGVAATIESVLHNYDDGRMDIVVRGGGRFEVMMVNEERSFLQAWVEYFDDTETDRGTAEQREKLAAHRADLMALADAYIDQGEFGPGATDLSFRLAELLPDMQLRVQLLATRSERERLDLLENYIPNFVRQQKARRHIQSVAPRNGHSRHLVSF
jgi:Lon protease-like protein